MMKDKQSSSKFDFDAVYDELVVPHFQELESLDSRRKNSSYSISDVCKSGFAVYSLKAPSLLAFRPKTPAEKSNLRACFGISELPSDSGLRKILDGVDSMEMRKVFDKTFQYLEDQQVVSEYKIMSDSILLSIDGVHHYSSKSVKCDCCLTKKHRDGTTTYSHSMLSAAMVCPGKSEVFIVDNEPIVQQDGEVKNDCERNAGKRLLRRIKEIHGSKSIVYAMDALYGCGPIIDLIKTSSPNWSYIINAKEDGHQHLFTQFDENNEKGKVEWKNWRRKEGTFEVGWINGLSLNASRQDLNVNMLIVNLKGKKGKVTTFHYLTDIDLKKENVMEVLSAGRSRWKIENEVFNTLKNQQYNFEHNFGHGQQFLATNFAYLMMLAFNVDQIRQYGSRIFRSIWKGLKSKREVWDAFRVTFKMVIASSIDDLAHKLLSIYELKMIRV
ncbi:MAG: hypothetical protein AAF705_15285 [Bacteroidota bacterium]